MPHSIKNALLEATKNKVETVLPEELKGPVESAVKAGMKLLYSPQTHDKIIQPIYTAMQSRGFQPQEIATSILNLIATIGKASQGRMAVEAAFPAGVILLCYVLDDLEQMKGLTVTKEMLKAIGSAMTKGFAASAQKTPTAPTTAPTAAVPPAPSGVANTPPAPAAHAQGTV